MTTINPYDENANRERLSKLRSRGVDVWGSERVYIDADVKLENIEPKSSIQNATLRGSELQIGQGTSIGRSGHALVENCQVGRNVQLGTGSYIETTILDDACIRDYAEFRPGTLVEEQVTVAHSVALKNTVLTATVVTGSLINCCDIFMGGGTSRKRHSEVGSGVIHFNFDPRGDKWSSLVGDVRSALLRSDPIFIGGQCGLVGPVNIGFGAVVAAGSIVRKDVTKNQLYSETTKPQTAENFDPEIYMGLQKKILSTAYIIGNLWALDAWYRTVRIPTSTDREKFLYRSARKRLQLHIEERIRKINKVIAKLNRSIQKSTNLGDSKFRSYQAEHHLLIERSETLENVLTQSAENFSAPKGFMSAYETARLSHSHLDAIQAVDENSAQQAAQWLHEIAYGYTARVKNLITGPKR